MGVSFKACSCCSHNFPDTIYYVNCLGCGKKWCSDECAEIDDCIEIEDGEALSCKYCRKEDFNDSELLKTALELLDKTREELIKIHREKSK